MARINLLPWRDELRKLKQEEFIISIVLIAVAAVAIVFGVAKYLDSQIAEQQDMKRIVDAKVAEVNLITAKIKDIETRKDVLKNKISVIQALQKSRPESVHFIDAVAQVVPEGIFLNELKQEGTRVELKGKVRADARVSAFIRNIETNPWLIEPKLNIIEGSNKNKNVQLNDFTIYIKQRQSNAEDEDGDI